jgi:glutathione S-transferase
VKLYYTPNSPYGRIARVALRDSGLIAQTEEIEVTTRAEGTPYFDITPLARVPLLQDGDVKLGDTRDICGYFDAVTGVARWLPSEDHEARFLRHMTSGFLDGVAVWLRENGRVGGQRSDPVMRYEEHRARRALAWFETRWDDRKAWDFTALSMAVAVDIAKDRGMDEGWSEIAPGVMGWAAARADAPHMHATAPEPM